MPLCLTVEANEMLARLSPRLSLPCQLATPSFALSDTVPAASNDRAPLDGVASAMPAFPTVSSQQQGSKDPPGAFAEGIARLCGRGASIQPSLYTTPSASTAHTTTDAGLVASLLAGRVVGMSKSVAAATGLAAIDELEHEPPRWSGDRLASIGGETLVPQLAAKLGPIDSAAVSPAQRQQQNTVSHWLQQRFGFDRSCIVAPCLPSSVAAFLSFLPQDNDIGLGTSSTHDEMIVPLSDPRALPSLDAPAQLLPDPVDPSRRWLAVVRFEGAAEARQIARDTSASGRWSTFSKVVHAVPFGATPSLDDKRYALFAPRGPRRGLHRFEAGEAVPAFGDTRADPRVVLEGQAMAMRSALEDIATSAAAAAAAASGAADDERGGTRRRAATLRPQPRRVYGWGKAAGDPSVASVVRDVVGGSVVVARDDVERASETPKPLPRARRAMVGAALYGLFEADASRFDSFERVVEQTYGLAAPHTDVPLSPTSTSSWTPHAARRTRVQRDANGRQGSEVAINVDARRLVEVAAPDAVMVDVYSALLVEHRRLATVLAKAQTRNES
ncbi:uncharacterized protein PFL1_02684 [Pseudozyma flocculosa PF-1]|nr:uncharacterized protein PFL1_02684 [Pseudozyma flocculosa PF-1]EPQ30011.1 hypothetical protein PFL1_02684 [Pseudozyma flocculosa PF-1]